MKELRFTWDPKKARTNCEEHGVAVKEARPVFYDEYAVEFYNDTHSKWEDRFLLLVCHCYREAEYVIRIVSAR